MNAMTFAKWTPVRADPPSSETDIIIRAQSMLTKDGKLGPVLTYEAALQVVESGQSQAAPLGSPLGGIEPGSGTSAADAIGGHEYDAPDAEEAPPDYASIRGV